MQGTLAPAGNEPTVCSPLSENHTTLQQQQGDHKQSLSLSHFFFCVHIAKRQLALWLPQHQPSQQHQTAISR